MSAGCAHGRQAHARLELAQVLRAHGATYMQSHPMATVQRRAITAIETCRTAALGGHARQCDACGAITISYNSCRNRHCPKCQTLAKERWVAARAAELMPVPYFHLVFTLPHALNSLAQANPRTIYAALFQAASETLMAFGHNARWLGGELGATLVLHTWGQNLGQHLHVHALAAGAALAADGALRLARPGFLFPVKALSRVFRGKYLAALEYAFAHEQLRFGGGTQALQAPRAFAAFVAQLRQSDWVVYAKRPFAGPRQVLAYLGRYTHRVAISNQRLVSLSETAVRFRWRDYAHDNATKVMTLAPEEFIRRFLLHVLPTGFMRIRHYGWLANRNKGDRLPRLRQLLDQPAPPKLEPESVVTFLLRVCHIDITRCPHCGEQRLRLMETFYPRSRSPP
ncbi:IS91 family transposase [Sulfurirhabdus autotrophica]|uniref:Transposase-like zinc-binding protein n=1 Tax=Sulfurirhabdus autotrophica TaxID=1706046 RepID=A0A4R3XWQ4_9PROT|nr:IS91 family transposase [Sulfurirhabdus autotrophica]TCV82688.1 transposase-like zinc-binding protein [Sulfurirhabdus autotrophica]